MRTPAQPPAPWNGDHLRTRFFDALSLMLPSGEAFVIQAVADWLEDERHGRGAPEDLRVQARQFVREEQSHQRAHRLYNERLSQQGLPARELEARIEAAVAELGTLGLPTRLALAAAFEHLTALLSVEVLRGRVWLSVDAGGREARLWRWHCEEEVGHRHVVRDLAAASRVGFARRAGCLLLASLYLGFDVVRLLTRLLRHDMQAGALRRFALAGQACRLAAAAAPGLLRMGLGWLGYLRPASHPAA
ncbi:metal-dependent hydrolase [Methylibium rhizosphaerae]|uniref:metal-dependent hydrolase n=1 Tax=Methylibium rhizosphaerae TaxID=2570323 RepID=UPI001127C1DA|nr:metal-dependent hydrolase [Methylibium rhizosphaerae]